MDTTFTAYPDSPEVTPTTKDKKNKSMSDWERKVTKRLKSQNKVLMRIIELHEKYERERQAASEAAVAKAAKKAAKKEKKKAKKKAAKKEGKGSSFWGKFGDAVVKAIPAAISAAVVAVAKMIFQNKGKAVGA